MASAETPAAVYDDERNEREKTPVSYSFYSVYIFPFVRLSSIERERREKDENFYYLSSSSSLLFSAIKKTKTLSSSFSRCFLFSFFFPSLSQKTLPTTMDNKSEILEQKKQSETALASARANAEQR